MKQFTYWLLLCLLLLSWTDRHAHTPGAGWESTSFDLIAAPAMTDGLHYQSTEQNIPMLKNKNEWKTRHCYLSKYTEITDQLKKSTVLGSQKPCGLLSCNTQLHIHFNCIIIHDCSSLFAYFVACGWTMHHYAGAGLVRICGTKFRYRRKENSLPRTCILHETLNFVVSCCFAKDGKECTKLVWHTCRSLVCRSIVL